MSKELKRIEPVNSKEIDGTEYEYRYRFNEIHHEDIDEDIEVSSGVELDVGDDSLEWQYGEKPVVKVIGQEVYTTKRADTKEARNQAYFCLSILADNGLVSGWRKQ